MITRETIIKYLNVSCDDEEAAIVSKFLSEHPDALSEYLGEDEWDHHQVILPPDAERSNRWWQQVSARTELKRPVAKLYFIKIAAAACVLFLVGLFSYRYFKKPDLREDGGYEMTVKTVVNSTNVKKVLQLSDSSVVELMPNSSIRYPQLFGKNKREVELTGAARFTVSKDTGRPFSVESGSIVTTALGTSFTVNSSQTDIIKVSLHEGKVVIRPVGTGFASGEKAYYLLPGDVLVYNNTDQTVRIIKEGSGTSDHRKAGADLAQTGKRPNGQKAFKPQGRQGVNWYMVNNQPLTEVFDLLQKVYRTPLYYNKDDLKGMTFIGKIDETDSLEDILYSLALLNHLKLSKKDNGYELHK